MIRALIIVDVQNDFCEGGALGVDGGGDVARAVTHWARTEPYDCIVATRDHHIDPGDHFSDTPDFSSTWPPHCRVGTDGALFHPNFDSSVAERIFSKGEYSAAYSGFEGADDDGVTLADYLRARNVSAVDVVGIATDYCVRATALDARAHGLSTTVLLPLTAAVAEPSRDAAISDMESVGVVVATALDPK